MPTRPAKRRIVDPAMRRSIPALVLLVLYLLVLLALTMAPTRRVPTEMVNLIPFKSIVTGIQRGGWLFNVNVLGNMIAFMPLGLLVAALRGWRKSGAAVIGSGALISVAIEGLQWLFARRVADIDDVMLNVVGALLGYGCAILLHKLRPPPADSPTRE